MSNDLLYERHDNKMTDKILKVNVVLKERIWGGNYLARKYNSDNNNLLGEAWVFSGHENGQSKILNGTYKDMLINDVYLKYPKLFGGKKHDRFPLLIKVLDAEEDLSVQVHPDNDYALKHHNDFGKNECWYILDANPNSSIVFGVNAHNKSEFKLMIDNNNWSQALKKVFVKKDEFYDIPTGRVHAIGSGIKILEIQQSSDTTYRIYDYDRIDKLGNKRELHIKEALDVIDYKESESSATISHGPVTRYVSNDYFTVDKITSKNLVLVNQDKTYSILYAHNADLTVIIDNEEYTIEEGYSVLITALTDTFKVKSEGSVFVIREDAHQINKSYEF